MAMILSSQSTKPITPAMLLGEDKQQKGAELKAAEAKLDRMLAAQQKRRGGN